jgi:Holliday junction resolvase RusA-like endonuclease
MKILAVRVFGIPKPQPRLRAFAKKMGNVYVARVYEAGTAEAWKSDVIRTARPQRPASPIEGPLRVSIDFLLPRPKRLMRQRDPDGPIYCESKPDRDNLEKAVLDAFKTDGWFRDDCQVVSGEVRKFYHAKAEAPGACVVIETWDSIVPQQAVQGQLPRFS